MLKTKTLWPVLILFTAAVAVDAGLVVRIEQEAPFDVAPVADDRFAFEFHPQGWSEQQSVNLEFNRSGSGEVTGFKLSADSERDIVFERRERLAQNE